MSKFKPDPPLPGDPLNLKKLKLEIIELNKKTRRQLMPAITALISVLGLIVGVLIFGLQQASEQEKNRVARELERRTALQNRISSETDEILRFPGDPKLTISRVAFLLADIQSMLDSPISRTALDAPDRPSKKLADVLPGYADSLTRSLVILVRDECDLSRNSRDAGLARAVSRYWSEYPNYLAQKPTDALNYILWQYTKALQSFHAQNPGYLESFHKTEHAIEPELRYQKQPNDDLRYNHLIDLSDGFKTHLKVLCRPEEDKDLLKGRFEEFQGDLSNTVVSEYLLKARDPDQFCERVLREEKSNGH